eukprot:12873270-Prorocentrum_lima.AAC.1
MQIINVISLVMYGEWLAIAGRRLAVCDHFGSSMGQRSTRDLTLFTSLPCLPFPFPQLPNGREGSEANN